MARYLADQMGVPVALSNLRLRTPGVSPGVKASEGWEGFGVKMWA